MGELVKPAYQSDANGVFVGVVMADRCRHNPQDWIVPGGAYLEAPPPFALGQHARREDASWIIEDAPAQISAIEGGQIVGVLTEWDGEARHTFLVTPPALKEGQRTGWTGKKWQVEDVPQPELTEGQIALWIDGQWVVKTIALATPTKQEKAK